ncbi:MAG: O-antigen ligase family protein, partial [Kiritimatiellia bacterium]|nr:O-antigen ligase family protein [Kiritimatiellia bacterium]
AALLLISAVGWYVIIQHVRGSRMVLNLERPAGYEMRASGTYFCPNHFANMAAMAMCLALALLFTPEAGWPLKLISGYSFILLGWPLLLTQSRSGVLGVLAGTGSFLLLAAIRRGTRALLIALVAVPLLLGAAGWGAWRYGPHMRERVMQAVRGLDRRDDWRILAWLGTVEMIRERPVWGHGGGSFRHVEPRHQTYHWGNTAVYAHNEILQAVSEYGLVGAGLLTVGLAILCWKLFVRVRKSRRPRNALLAAGCLSVFIGSFVHALFDFNFHIYSNSQFLMLVAGVTFSCLFADREWTARPVFEGRRGTIARGLGLALAVGLFLALLRSGLSYGISFPAAAARMAEQFDRSERLYRRALRIDSGDWETRRGLANTLLQGALHLRGEEKRQRLAESLREFEFALRINPHDVEGWYRLSHVYGLLGDDEKTLECLRETVKILPNFPYYRSRLGVQLYRMGRMNEAREAFDRVLLADSSDKTARMHLREIQRRQGR